MRDQRDAFFAALLGRGSPYHGLACLTLTALHPDGNRPTPSRHIRLGDMAALQMALNQLDVANRQGWGAYFAVGWRKTGLSRWRRGGAAEVVALPALFVDVDDPSPDALAKLRSFPITPSCIVHSGGGYHAYWWLDEPTSDLASARLILRGLASSVGGDSLSVAQSLRVVGSINTKSSRAGAVCHVIDLTERRYPFADFTGLLPKPQRVRASSPFALNPTSITHLSETLLRQGFKWRGDWLNGACPYPERHKHADHRPSFGYVESELLSSGQCTLPKSTWEYLANGAPVGRRNRALFAAACHFREAGYTMGESERLLVPRYLADSEGHESRQVRASEARRTIQSAYSRSPRQTRKQVNQYRSGR